MTEKELICVNCPMGCRLHVQIENGAVISVSGNSCPRGKAYAEKECVRPARILTTTVKISGGTHRVLPVITNREIPLDMIFAALEEVKKIEIEAPVKEGQIIVQDLLETGADLIASRSMERAGA